MVRRIHITGAAGAGTTTLGKALAERLGCSHFDTDDSYWLPGELAYQQKRPVPERLRWLHDALTPRQTWVLSGSLDGWGDPLIPLFDLVVFLEAPTQTRLDRLRAREQERFGASALQKGGAMYEHHREFLKWAASYDEGTMPGRSRPRHQAWLAQLPCRVIKLNSEPSIEQMLAELTVVCPELK
jgi:adenylate kinase family enzyme